MKKEIVFEHNICFCLKNRIGEVICRASSQEGSDNEMHHRLKEGRASHNLYEEFSTQKELVDAMLEIASAEEWIKY